MTEAFFVELSLRSVEGRVHKDSAFLFATPYLSKVKLPAYPATGGTGHAPVTSS